MSQKKFHPDLCERVRTLDRKPSMLDFGKVNFEFLLNDGVFLTFSFFVILRLRVGGMLVFHSDAGKSRFVYYTEQ